MPIATRTFRVFVSSTFEDLKAERDALQRDVFPKLRTLCEQHGARFQAIDLRWGVRDEAALDQQTMAICLREIERCKATGVRPNFIALLGDRYGWRPLPITIPAAEFGALRLNLPVHDAAVALQWYRLDENAVPPEYCLQSRTGEFAQGSTWNPIEQSLLQALATGARAAGLSEKELIKYETSATHQEILAGLGDNEEDREHVFGFVRRPTGNIDPRLEALKSRLHVHEFDVGDMKALCDLVLTQLTKVIEAEVKQFKDRPALDLEIEAHDRFAEDRCRIVVGRELILDTITDYIGGPERRPLVFHGESGSGKSAVMAKASQQYAGPGRVIRRFIGASPESASGHTLLTGLCRQIARGETPVDYVQLENAFRERLSTATAAQPLILFIDALDQLTASDPARDATWLPTELPPHVKVILSTTDDGRRLPDGLAVKLQRMTESEGGQALEELLRVARRTLQPWQRATVLARFDQCALPLYLKLAAEESRLWKSYTPEAACRLGDGISGVIDVLFGRLATDVNHGLVLVERSLGYLAAARHGLNENEVLDVLAADDAVWEDFERHKHHDVEGRQLPVIVWSRLWFDLEPYLAERASPGGAVISFFHRQLAARAAGDDAAQKDRHANLARYFRANPAWMDSEGNTPNVRRSVELPFHQRRARDWKAAEDTLFDAQFLIAKCAAGLALDLEADYRAVVAESRELAQTEALRLIHGALVLSMHVIVRDGRQYASQLVGRLLVHQGYDGIRQLVAEVDAGAPRPWLRPRYLSLTAPGGSMLASFDGHDSGVNAVAITDDGSTAVSVGDDGTVRVWDLEQFVCRRVLNGHDDEVNAVVLFKSSHGYVAVSGGGKRVPYKRDIYFRSYIEKTDQRPSRDNSIRIWDVQSGALLRVVDGHRAAVRSFTIVGGFLFSGSDDGTIRMLQLESPLPSVAFGVHGQPVVMLAAARGLLSLSEYDFTLWKTDRTNIGMDHFDPFLQAPLAVYPSRLLIALVSTSWSGDSYGLQIWDIPNSSEGRENIRTISTFGHGHFITTAQFMDDGLEILVGEAQGGLYRIDVATGAEKTRYEGHKGSVRCIDVASRADRMISGSSSGELIVWTLNAEGSSSLPKGHSDDVNAAAFARGGRIAVTGSFDKSILVWDAIDGRPIRTITTPRAVSCLAVSIDGCRVVSGSTGAVRAWDGETGTLLWESHCHRDGIDDIAIDGDVIVSASMDGTLCVLDSATGRVRLVFKEHSHPVSALTVVPGTGRVFSADRSGEIIAWNHNDGSVYESIHQFESAKPAEPRLLAVPRGPEWPNLVTGVGFVINSMAVSEDGSVLVVSQGEDSLWAWNSLRGGEIRSLDGHSSRVHRVVIAANGERAVSASHDGSVRLWDVSTGKQLTAFTADRALYCCAVSFGTNAIVAGEGGSGNVHFLELIDPHKSL